MIFHHFENRISSLSKDTFVYLFVFYINKPTTAQEPLNPNKKKDMSFSFCVFFLSH